MKSVLRLKFEENIKNTKFYSDRIYRMSEQPFEPGLPSASMGSWEVSAPAPSGSQENILRSQTFSILGNFHIAGTKTHEKQRKKDRSGFINSENSDHRGGKGTVGKVCWLLFSLGSSKQRRGLGLGEGATVQGSPQWLSSILKAPQSSKRLHSLRTKHSDQEPVGNILDTNHNVVSLSTVPKTEGLF